jgi:hypothetical protein
MASKYEERNVLLGLYKQYQQEQIQAWKIYNENRTRLNFKNPPEEDYKLVAESLANWDSKTILCDEAKHKLNKFKNLKYLN